MSKCPWERLYKVYASGDLGSLPSERRHLVVSMGNEYPASNVPVVRWDSMPRDASLDVIVAYDIIDHLPSRSDAGRFLSSCRESLAQEGMLYLFCHPFKSRLGNHLFDRNLAYFHLVRGVEGVHAIRIDDPLGFYRGGIDATGMEVREERVYREPMEPFFDRFSLDSDCEVQFVEYFIRR